MGINVVSKPDVNLLESRSKCLGITSDEEESLSVLIAQPDSVKAQLLTLRSSRRNLIVHQ